jgi:hypothetical protein
LYTHSQANDLLSPDQLHQEAGMVYDQLTETNQRLGLSIIPTSNGGATGYKIEYGGKAGIYSINLGYIGEQSSSFYVYGGDLNGDRINGMIYYLFLRKRVIFVLFQYLKI